MVLAENQEILSYCQLNHAQKGDIRRIGMQFACICIWVEHEKGNNFGYLWKALVSMKVESIRLRNAGPLLNFRRKWFPCIPTHDLQTSYENLIFKKLKSTLTRPSSSFLFRTALYCIKMLIPSPLNTSSSRRVLRPE